MHSRQGGFSVLRLLLVAGGVNAAVDSRLGSNVFSLPVYRADGGNNVVTLGVGNPPQKLNLTATTNEWYLALVGSDCPQCLQEGEEFTSFNESQSKTFWTSKDHLIYRFNYPNPPNDTLDMSGVFARDTITIPGYGNPAFNLVDVDAFRHGMVRQSLSYGTTGFWGLGIDPIQSDKSFVSTAGSLSGRSGFTFGVDLAPFGRNPPPNAGTIHWGGVPSEAHMGGFNWLSANASMGWSVPIDSIQYNGEKIDLKGYYATLDPGFDEIYVPPEIAERAFRATPAARYNSKDLTRWFFLCNTKINMSVTVGRIEYAVDSTTLVSSRWTQGTCSSNLVSWQSENKRKEIRLGAAFLSGVYAAFYHNKEEHFVGLAGKPGAVNGENVSPKPTSNKVVIGAVLGTIIPVFLIFLALCYMRHRRSVEATLEKRYRRAQRDEYKGGSSIATSGDRMTIAPTVASSPHSALYPTYYPVGGPPPVPPKLPHMQYAPTGINPSLGPYAKHPVLLPPRPGPTPVPVPVPLPVSPPARSPFGAHTWRDLPLVGRLFGEGHHVPSHTHRTQPVPNPAPTTVGHGLGRGTTPFRQQTPGTPMVTLSAPPEPPTHSHGYPHFHGEHHHTDRSDKLDNLVSSTTETHSRHHPQQQGGYPQYRPEQPHSHSLNRSVRTRDYVHQPSEGHNAHQRQHTHGHSNHPSHGHGHHESDYLLSPPTQSGPEYSVIQERELEKQRAYQREDREGRESRVEDQRAGKRVETITTIQDMKDREREYLKETERSREKEYLHKVERERERKDKAREAKRQEERRREQEEIQKKRVREENEKRERRERRAKAKERAKVKAERSEQTEKSAPNDNSRTPDKTDKTDRSASNRDAEKDTRRGETPAAKKTEGIPERRDDRRRDDKGKPSEKATRDSHDTARRGREPKYKGTV